MVRCQTWGYDVGVQFHPIPQSWLARLAVGLIIGAAIALGIVQYGWFNSAASTEIGEASQSLATRLYQVMARESQRLTTLATELSRLARAAHPSRSGLIQQLSALEATYSGAAGASFINWIALADSASPTPSWATVSSQAAVLADLPDPAAKDRLVDSLRQGNLLLVVPESGADRLIPPVQLMAAVVSDQRHLVALGINAQLFFSSSIVPALAQELKGYGFTWEFIRRPVPATADSGRPFRIVIATGPGTSPENDAAAYHFNPLTTLLGSMTADQRELRVTIPWYFELPMLPGPEPRSQAGPAPPAGSPPPGLLATKQPPPAPPALRPRMVSYPSLEPWRPRTSVLIKIRLPRDSPLANVEQRLARDWLFSTLLLVALTGAFLLLMFLFRRNQQQIQKEREFVAAITHELRTPLTVIVSAADNIAGGIIPADRLPQYGSLIKDQGERLTHLIEGVLLLSRFEGRSLAAPAPRTCDTTAFFAELAAKTAALITAGGHTLTWDCQAALPAITVETETLAFVLENLVRNAATHGPGPVDQTGKHRLQISVSIRRDLPDRLAFIVTDNGRGIPRQEQKRLGQAFYRTEHSRHFHEPGTGLGLYLIKQKLKAAKGDIRLESPYKTSDGCRHQGCRFTVHLPGVVHPS